MNAVITKPALQTLRREVDRILDRLAEGEPPLSALGRWQPKLDLIESEDAYRVRLEIPGVDPAAVQLTLNESTLTVRGHKPGEAAGRCVRRECGYGDFLRQVELPGPVEESGVRARFQNGVLHVFLDKAVLARGTTIPIVAA